MKSLPPKISFLSKKVAPHLIVRVAYSGTPYLFSDQVQGLGDVTSIVSLVELEKD